MHSHVYTDFNNYVCEKEVTEPYQWSWNVIAVTALWSLVAALSLLKWRDVGD